MRKRRWENHVAESYGLEELQKLGDI